MSKTIRINQRDVLSHEHVAQLAYNNWPYSFLLTLNTMCPGSLPEPKAKNGNNWIEPIKALIGLTCHYRLPSTFKTIEMMFVVINILQHQATNFTHLCSWNNCKHHVFVFVYFTYCYWLWPLKLGIPWPNVLNIKERKWSQLPYLVFARCSWIC